MCDLVLHWGPDASTKMLVPLRHGDEMCARAPPDLRW